MNSKDWLIDVTGINTEEPRYGICLNERWDSQYDAQKKIKEIVKTYSIVKVFEIFREKTSANTNGTSLWHGIDDILNGKVPQFLIDNLSESEIEVIETMLQIGTQ